MYQKVLTVVLLCGAVIFTHSLPARMVTKSETHQVCEGENVEFACEVEELGELVLFWRSVAHNLIIRASGDPRHTKDSKIYAKEENDVYWLVMNGVRVTAS